MREAARPALDSDVPRIVELSRPALDDVASRRGGAMLRAHELRGSLDPGAILQILHDDDRCVWMGTLDELPVGVAAGHLELLPAGARLGVIDCAFVEPAARGVGVGEAMLQGLVSWFGASGCTGVDARALPGDRASKRFFESAGFTARLLVLHRSLEP